jgi:hypothetical protein
VSASISPSPFRFLAVHSLLYVDFPTSSSSPCVHGFPHPGSVTWASESSPSSESSCCRTDQKNRRGVTVGGEFPLRALSVARRVPSSTMAPPGHRIFLSLSLQGSSVVVPRSSGFYPPHGYPASQALSPQYYPWICHPLPPSRSGVTVTGSVFYGRCRPQGRRTSRGKTHSLSVSRPASVYGGYNRRILGLAQPRLLAPLRTPI